MTLRAPTRYSRDIQRPAQMPPAKIIDGPSPQSALLRIELLLLSALYCHCNECLPVLGRVTFLKDMAQLLPHIINCNKLSIKCYM